MRTALAALGLLLLTACPSKDATSPGQDPGNTGGNQNLPPGVPLGVHLSAGSYWEYFWTSESQSTAQGSSPTYDATVGLFRVTLGTAVTIGGVTAYPLTVTGTTSDGTEDFAPDWTHLAVDAQGSLKGSKDGVTLTTIYNAATSQWTGGGFFVPIPATQGVGAAAATFPGVYNSVAAVRVGRQTSTGGCTYYPSVGQTICSGDPTTLSENEYYKGGIGPLGYVFSSTAVYTGGGFTSSYRFTRTVELIGTNLAATDGTVFTRPPWQEVAPLNVPRYRHSAVALNGKIYVIGGLDASNTALSSVEIYDPATNIWTSGTGMRGALSSHSAEVLNGKIYVVPLSGAVRIYDPATDQWTTGATVPFSDPSFGTCAMQNDYVMVATPNGAFTGQLQTPFYRASTNLWAAGTPLAQSDRRWAAVACVGTTLYLAGGYRQFLSTVEDRTIVKYDAVAGTWTSGLATMADAHDMATATTLNGEVVVLGGQNATADLRSVEAYNPTTNAWRRLSPMFRPRREFDAVTLNGKIYVIGGHSGSSILNNVEAYTP